jgi:hypothetical protein
MTATEVLAIYVLSLFFGFFFLNYAAISAKPAAWLKRVLGPTWGYPLSCAFCWAGWTTICLFLVGFVPAYYLTTAPVLHLFLDALYDRVCSPPAPLT